MEKSKENIDLDVRVRGAEEQHELNKTITSEATCNFFTKRKYMHLLSRFKGVMNCHGSNVCVHGSTCNRCHKRPYTVCVQSSVHHKWV